MNKRRKKEILEKIFWNGTYSLACDNCKSIIILDFKKREELFTSYEIYDARKILDENLRCCEEPQWYWNIVDVSNPNKIYYWEDIKKFFRRYKI